MLHLTFSLIKVLLALILFACGAFAQEKIGYVLDVNGDWYLTNNAEMSLKKGSALPAGISIKARWPKDVTHFIVIADRNGRIIEKRYCRDQGACDRPIQLPQVENQRSLTARLLDAVMGLWGSEAPKYKTFGSRSGARGLRESVAVLREGRIDLKDAFAGFREGEYRIRFVVPADQSNRVVLGPVAVTLAGGGSAPVTADSLTPGLYEVQTLDPETQQPLEIGTEAWVLVTTPGDFPALSAQFNDALTITKSWGDQVKVTTVCSFLRAYLDYLASQSKK